MPFSFLLYRPSSILEVRALEKVSYDWLIQFLAQNVAWNVKSVEFVLHLETEFEFSDSFFPKSEFKVLEAADSGKVRVAAAAAAAAWWKGPRSFDVHFFVSFLPSTPKASNACHPRADARPAQATSGPEYADSEQKGRQHWIPK